MISCTEFIPLYNELFQYIDDQSGHDALILYWKHISDVYVRARLGSLVKKNGLAGCYEYWAHSLNEEAADFIMIYDDITAEFSIDMRYCPSRGMLNALTQIKPYYDYCGHCSYLYSPILAEYGIEANSGSFVDANHSCCHESYHATKEKKIGEK